MNVRTFSAVAFSALTALMTAGSASATTISGLVNVAGSVSVSATQILFNPLLSPQGAATGSFTGFTGGTIQSLTATSPTSLTGAQNIPAFATFNVAGVSPVFFDLTNIFPGIGSNAACSTAYANANPGSTCTLTNSPFNLQQTATGVTATLALSGKGYTGTPTQFSPTVGLFTAQFVFSGANLDSVLSQLAGGGTISNVSYSATFSATPTPEPTGASMLIAGLGLLASSQLMRKLRRN